MNTRKDRLSWGLLSAIALLSASGPFAIDMYVSAMPIIATDLDTTAAMVALTLSGFVAGLAVGQLVAGPLSDGLGRKKLLVPSVLLALLAAVLAAVAPTIGVLIVARFIHGLASGACVVLARAVIPDLLEGPAATRSFSLMMSVQTIAPIVAPVVGGFLVDPIGWRGLMWVLAGICAVQLVVALRFIPETLPPQRRSPNTVAGVLGNFRYVLASAPYRGFLVAFAFSFTTMFAYIAASSFVVQGQLGYSVRFYSLMFGVNAVGLLLANMLNAWLATRIRIQTTLKAAMLTLILASGGILLFFALGTWPDPVFFILLFIGICQVGVLLPSLMSMGQQEVRERAGSASALMGFFQFGLSALIGPLVGVGANQGMTMAAGMLISSLIAAGGLSYGLLRHGD